jgi:hypothetical protein
MNNTDNTGRRPRRTLWEQIRDRLLSVRGLCLDKLAAKMDATAAAEGFRDRHLFLAICLHHFTHLTYAQRRTAMDAYFPWAGTHWRAEDAAKRDAEARNPTQPPIGTVTIEGELYDVRKPPDLLRDEKGCGVHVYIDHTNGVVWVNTLSHRDDLAALVKRATGSDLQPAGAEQPPPPRRVVAGEKLPPGELDALADDLRAVEWAMLAPAGWPLPPNLPADAKFTDHEQPGIPPTIMSGERSGMRLHCPHCGKGCKTPGGWGIHVVRVHGWQADTRGGWRPVLEGRAAA